MDLQDIAVLSAFSGTAFSSRVNDSEVTEETNRRHNANDDAGTWKKNLFPESVCGNDNAHRRTVRFIEQTRDWHNERTCLYSERGWRLLKQSCFEEHDAHITAQVERLAAEYMPQLRSEYYALVEMARDALNGTFRSEDYPPVNEFVARFTMSIKYRPVPESDRLLQDMTGARIDALRSQLASEQARRIEEATADAWQRILGPVIELAERLADPERRKLDGIVNKVRNIAGLVPAFNLTNDSSLAAAAVRVNELLNGISPEALADNGGLRVQTATQLVEVAKRFGRMGERKFA